MRRLQNASSVSQWHQVALAASVRYTSKAARFEKFSKTIADWQHSLGYRVWQNRVSTIARMRWIPITILLIGCWTLVNQLVHPHALQVHSQSVKHNLWHPAPSFGWLPCSARQSDAWVPPRKSYGYLLVRCSGDLSHQRICISDAVVAARLMNATMVVPQIESKSVLRNESGFAELYDVDHFIDTLKYDVRVVRSLPTSWVKNKETTELRPFEPIFPPDAGADWYETTGARELKQHGAIYLPKISNQVAEALHDPEYKRLRCRVNYHALKFSIHIKNLTNIILERLRSEGPYMAIDLRFDVEALTSAGCLGMFNSSEQEGLLKDYWKEKVPGNVDEPNEIGKISECPLTPIEVGLFLRALGFDDFTRIYIAIRKGVNVDRFLGPLRELFPRLESQYTIATSEEWAHGNLGGHGLLESAVDYIICLLSDIFVPTYEGTSNFANDLIGQRLYFGFRTTVLPDRKALAPLFTHFEGGLIDDPAFHASVMQVVNSRSSGSPRSRLPGEPFFRNPWPECFCSRFTSDEDHNCPPRKHGSGPSDKDVEDNFAHWNV